MAKVRITNVQDAQELLCTGGFFQVGGRYINPDKIVRAYLDSEQRPTFELCDGQTVRHRATEEGEVGDLLYEAIAKGNREYAQQFLQLASELWVIEQNGRDVNLYDREGNVLQNVQDGGNAGDFISAVWDPETEALYVLGNQTVWKVERDGTKTDLYSAGGDITFYGMGWHSEESLFYFHAGSNTNDFHRLYTIDRAGNLNNLGDLGTFDSNLVGFAIDRGRGLGYFYDNGRNIIWTVDLAGVSKQELDDTGYGMSANHTFYSSETDLIYFDSNAAGEVGLHSVEAADGTDEQLRVFNLFGTTFLPEYSAFVGTDGEDNVAAAEEEDYAKEVLFSVDMAGVEQVIPIPKLSK